MEKLKPCTLLVGMQNGAQLQKKKQYGASSKIKKQNLPYDLRFQLLDIYIEKLKSGSQRRISTTMFIIKLSSIAKM